MRVLAVTCLMGLLGWIFTQLPDDLGPVPRRKRVWESQSMFSVFFAAIAPSYPSILRYPAEKAGGQRGGPCRS
jgi:hypothetical protein